MAAMKVNDRATNVYRLRDFLKKRYPSDVLMPINADTKSPKFSHKGGRWTWDDLERQLPRLTTDDVEPDDVCILVKELVVVDADTNEACEALEEKHAAFRNTPKVKTKKGAHYYLERTPYCDEIGLYNGVRSKHAVEEDQQIDVRTITATGTAGVVVAPPSTNKEWVVSPWERPILKMPNEVADWLKELMNPLTKSSVGESGNQGRDGSTPGHEVPIEEHMHIIEAAEELLARVGGHDKCRYIKVTKNNLGFSVQFKGRRTCPGPAGEEHVNNTFFVQLYNDGNAYYYCQSKECQQSYPLGRYKTIQWVEEAEEAETIADDSFLIEKAESVLQEGLSDTSSRVRSKDRHADRYVFHFGTRISTNCPGGHTHTGDCFQIDLVDDGTASYRCKTKECEYYKTPLPLGRWKESADTPLRPADQLKFDRKYADTRYTVYAYLKDKRGGQEETRKIYKELVAYTNHYLAVVEGKSASVVEETFDARGYRTRFVIRSLRETREVFCNCEWVSEWLKAKERRTYAGFQSCTKGKPAAPDYYNIFCGLRVERDYDLATWEYDPTKIDLILKHYFEVICNSNKDCFHYLMTWHKKVIVEQRKTGVVPVLTGDIGIGKSLIAQKFINELIIGMSNWMGQGAGAAVHSCHALFTNFNTLLVGVLFAVIDEPGLWDGNKKQVAEFKAKITEPVIVWERKGVDAVNTEDYTNYVLLTNEENPVKIEPNDRRFLVLKPSSHRLGDTAYFRALIAQIEAEGSAAHFYKYLESFEGDTRIIGDKNCLPMTNTKKEMLEHALSPEVRFVIDLVEGEREILPFLDNPAGVLQKVMDGAFYSTTELYDAYCRWWDKNGMQSPYRAKKCKPDFQKQFLKITGLESEKRSGRRGVTWTSTEGVTATLKKNGVLH